MTVLVTGATGFLGRALSSELAARNYRIRGTTRSESPINSYNPKENYLHLTEDIGPDTDWSKALEDIDCVIHCAARAPVMHETKAGALSAYRQVNVAGTRNLAQQAAAAGVKRFIFLSSIKVNGERTRAGAPFTPETKTFPEDAYGLSKREAEQVLHEISAGTGLEIVIIRPPLVYGPGVKGNFLTLLDWLYRGVPLPLGAIDNQRSLVGLDNLVDLMITCIHHRAAAHRTFLVSDAEDLSTPALLRRIAKALDKPVRLLPVPPSVLQFGAQFLGKKDIAQRLLGSLQVDMSQTGEVLGWTPVKSVDEQLHKTADWYLRQR